MRASRIAAAAAVGLVVASPASRADDAASTAPPTASLVAPPPSERSYIQYGVALVAEIVAAPGPACSATDHCILGSGGGAVARAGWRPTEALYVGGAYEMTKQDPHQLYRLAILQQLRAEVRAFFPTGRETSPFFLLGAGVSGYGNDWWPADTGGPSASVGAGLELQLGGTVLVVSLAYRPVYFHSWVDSSTLPHEGGFAHFVGIEAAVEAQDTL